MVPDFISSAQIFIDNAEAKKIKIRGSDSNKILKNTLAIRDTYLDPLSLIQVLLLQKLQMNELTDYEKTSLLLSVNGLAAGLRNTG